jgi:hypothetical protein
MLGFRTWDRIAITSQAAQPTAKGVKISTIFNQRRRQVQGAIGSFPRQAAGLKKVSVF